MKLRFFTKPIAGFLILATSLMQTWVPSYAETLPSSATTYPTSGYVTSSALLSGYETMRDILNASATQMPSAGRVFYLSTTGSDNNNGLSAVAAFGTLQRAVSQLQAGDTLKILEGTYRQSVNMTTSGTIDNFITIEGVGNVVFDGTTLYEFEPIFDTAGKNYIQFLNLTVNNARSAVSVTGASHHIVIDGLKTDGNDFAVQMKDSASFITIRNAIAMNSRNSFRGEGTVNNVLMENIETYLSKDIYTGYDPNYTNGDGFIFENQTHDLTFRNIISGDHWDGGIDCKGNNVLIENVIVFGNKNGLKLWGNNITVVNALSFANKRQAKPDGTFVDGNGVNLRRGTSLFINCTFVDNESVDFKIGTSEVTTHLENSIVAHRVSLGALYANYGTFTQRNVLWYKEGSSPNVPLANGSFWANPGFVDWAAKDFHLASGSAAIDRGVVHAMNSEFDLDYAARVVNNVIDLGVYEFQPANRPPVIGVPDAVSASENQPLTLSLAGSDPDGDPLTYAATGLPQGASFSAAGIFTWIPSYNQAGNYDVTFSVSDGTFRTDKLVTISVLNVNRPPVFQSLGDKIGNENELMTFTAQANDADGDNLVYSAEGLPPGAVYDTATRIFSWTPNAVQSGDYTVIFKANDGQAIAQKSILITIRNTDTTNVIREVVATLNAQNYKSAQSSVIKSGTDVLISNGNNSITYEVNAAQVGEYFLNISTAQAPGPTVIPAGYKFHIELYVDGAFKAAYDLAAADTFTVSQLISLGTISQGTHAVRLKWTNDKYDPSKNIGTNLALKNLVISKASAQAVNRPPAIGALSTASVTAGQPLTLNVAGSDPDGNALTYSAAGLPQGSAFNLQTGQFSWTPTIAQAGNYQVTFSVFDGWLRTDKVVTISVLAVVNQPPVLSIPSEIQANEGQLVSFTVQDSDPNGDPLIYSVQNLPPGANFDPATRVFTWRPGSRQAGYYDVIFKVNDGQTTTQRLVTFTIFDTLV